MSPFRPAALCVSSLALLASMPALAADPTTDDPVVLDPIVVTAARFEQKLTSAPASISIVTREEIQTRPYASLTDILRDVEGVDVDMESQNDKNAMGYVTLRGMPSDYTLVLIDGRRQSNVGDIFPNYYGSGQSGFIPPVEAIERVEVVRGPMSTLYGSDAMGGVVNIITRRVADHWGGSATLSHTFQSESRYGDDSKVELYANGPLIRDRLGLALHASIYDREASSRAYPSLPLPDGTVWDSTIGEGRSSASAENWAAGLRLAFTPNADHDLLLDIDLARQEFGNSGTQDTLADLWRSGNATIVNPNFDPSRPPGAGNPATITRRMVQPRGGYAETQQYERDQFALTHVARWPIGVSTTSLTYSVNRNLGRTMPMMVDERQTLQGLWNAACVAGGGAAYCSNARMDRLTAQQTAQLQAFLPRPLRPLEIRSWVLDTMLDMELGSHKLAVGAQYHDAEMEDGVFGMYGGGFVAGASQQHRQWALFAEDNWNLRADLTLTLGLRYDHHNVFGEHISPRAYLVWTVNDDWTVKGGVSTGYKTPKPNQLFDGINGFRGQGAQPLVGSPDLQPETSTNYEVAAYYDNHAGFSVNATAFLNKFEDKIATSTLAADRIKNCEVAAPGEACVQIGQGWASLGYLDFVRDINVDRAESRGVELAARWDISERWSLRGNYTYTHSEAKTGAQAGRPIPGLETVSVSTPAKHMANVTLGWAATDRLDLSLRAEGRYDRYRGYDDIADAHLYYSDHTLLHLGANWRVNDRLALNVRINNLLDEDYQARTCLLATTQDSYSCFDNYLVKDQRRSIWTSLVARF